ncbi:hypothetical protein LSAT2_000981 [Lamellibrachia satsuma]|nr:hypothetical protein LSAT2_000981 [Lamellibrachia satsuma]
MQNDTRSDTDRQQKALEGKNKKLEDNITKLQEQVHAIETKKVLELAKWRDERDKLVGGLETILKQKDVRICELEANAKPPKSGSRQEQDMVTALRAKDAIISDLKEQNHQLQSRLTDPPVERVKEEPTTRRVTRGRHKKRMSSVAVEEATLAPPRRKRTSRMQSTRKSHKRDDENVDPQEVVIKEECIDLDHITTPKRHQTTTRTALNNSTNLVTPQNSQDVQMTGMADELDLAPCPPSPQNDYSLSLTVLLAFL